MCLSGYLMTKPPGVRVRVVFQWRVRVRVRFQLRARVRVRVCHWDKEIPVVGLHSHYDVRSETWKRPGWDRKFHPKLKGFRMSQERFEKQSHLNHDSFLSHSIVYNWIVTLLIILNCLKIYAPQRMSIFQVLRSEISEYMSMSVSEWKWRFNGGHKLWDNWIRVVGLHSHWNNRSET